MLRGGQGQGLRHLVGRAAVQVGQAARGQVRAGAAVELGRGGVGLEQLAGVGIDQELDGAVRLKDLAVQAFSRGREGLWVAGRLAQTQAALPRKCNASV